MYQYLAMLTNVSLIRKIQDEINQNEPNMTEKLAEMSTLNNETILAELFNADAFEQNDDFKQMFESHFSKIFHFAYFFFIFIFNTIFNALLIHFEKFGGDPTKRSLKNQLIAQTGYANIILILLVAPLWIFRILIGPIYLSVVEVYSTFHNTFMTWYVSTINK